MEDKNVSVIKIENFSKSFGDVKVVKDLSFEVNKGDIFAFIGANGSGKTTTIRCLLGIYGSDEGQLTINGKVYSPDDSNMLGYLPEERGLYLNSRVLETMIYFGQLKGMEKEAAKKFSEDFLMRVGLADKAKTEIKKLSSGQQQKIQLGITIINSPKLLILDEPTKGLDPVNRQLMLDMLFELNKNGSTIIFSTHQMEEAERIANRMLMIKQGKKALYGDIDDIKKSFSDGILKFTFSGDKFPENNKLYELKVENHTAEVNPTGKTTQKAILKHLLDQNIEITKFEQATPSLNEIFIKVTENDKY